MREREKTAMGLKKLTNDLSKRLGDRNTETKYKEL